MAEIGNVLQSIFPDYPREQPAVDKEGNFNALVDLGLGSLFQALQQNFKNEGIVVPPLSATNMATIQALYTSFVGGLYSALTLAQPDISGQTVFDTTTQTMNQFVVGTDGASPPNVTLAEWVPFAMLLTGAGAPAGAVAAVTFWLYYDTVGMALYICTAGGNAASATWAAL